MAETTFRARLVYDIDRKNINLALQVATVPPGLSGLYITAFLPKAADPEKASWDSTLDVVGLPVHLETVYHDGGPRLSVQATAGSSAVPLTIVVDGTPGRASATGVTDVPLVLNFDPA